MTVSISEIYQTYETSILFAFLVFPLMQKWTKEETDQLFDLCERFDLRFIVIADRFPSSRTVEELKDRYYSGIYCCFVNG